LCGCLPPFVFDYIVCKNRDEAVLRWRGSSWNVFIVEVPSPVT
jgi:hypothetical protein